MNPRVSICIPTYNRLAFLREALAPVLTQIAEESLQSSVEIVLSDNASTDGTVEYIETLRTSHPELNITFERFPENRGPDANIYNSVKLATGEFVYILSDDDVLLPGALKKLFALIECYPDVDGYSLNIRSFLNDPSEPGPVWHPVPEDTVVTDRSEALDMLRPAFVSVITFRRSLIASNDYSNRIGTYLIQSYLFLDVLAHEGGVVVTQEPFLAQRKDNTGGWPFWEVMTTHLKNWLNHAKALGYSKVVIDRIMSIHLTKHLFTSALSFKLGGGKTGLAPRPMAYVDGIRRVLQVYRFNPFSLFVLIPLMLIPGPLLRQARDLYRHFRPHTAT